MHDVTVESRMTRSVHSVGPNETLSSVATLLEKNRVSAVPVVEGSTLLGVISTSDLVDHLVVSRSGENTKAADLALRGVVTVSTRASVEEAARILRSERIHRLFVLDQGRVAGVLSTSDLLSDVKEQGSMLPISELMSKSIISVDIGDTLREAVFRLSEAYVHGVVVLDEQLPIGVFTHREALASRGIFPVVADRSVEDAMSYETICLDEKIPVHRAARYAHAMDVRRLLIVRDRRLVGVVSSYDLACSLSNGLGA